jgi:hypothetical protein
MGIPESDRDEPLDWLAEEFLARVAEHPFDLAVHEDDPPVGIGHEQAARRRLHRGTKVGLYGPIQRFCHVPRS